jgi:hypothetical protein
MGLGTAEAITVLKESLRLFTELRLPHLARAAQQELDRC